MDAGLALLFQNSERRRTLALYMLARLLQCRYNSLKAAGRWHFWGSDWQHGDTLLFAVSSAQASSLLTRNLNATRSPYQSVDKQLVDNQSIIKRQI